MLETDDGTVAFPAGWLAFYRGDEELRGSNDGLGGLTLLAFLLCRSRPTPTYNATKLGFK